MGSENSDMTIKETKPKDDKIHPMLRLVDHQKIPTHVAIIMDGNGRWARARGFPRIEGHKEGVEGVRAAVEAARDLKVKYLTLYAFSVENWKRPGAEVQALFRLLNQYITRELSRKQDSDIRFRVIGRIEDLPKRTRTLLDRAIQSSEDAPGLTLTLSLSYGGRTEIIDACSKIVQESLEGHRSGPVSEEEFNRYLYAPDLPHPDLLIRTSGEFRISNFLLWQIAYSEIFVTDTLWPDFGKDELLQILRDFQSRDRRYGKV
jgi:undecaprenyl diphosphate synthase